MKATQWYDLSNFRRSCFGAIKIDGKVCIVDTLLRNYIPNYIKPTRNINNITCVCETYISDMLLKSYLNKWKISKLAKIYELYINPASTRLKKKQEWFHLIQESNISK